MLDEEFYSEEMPKVVDELLSGELSLNTFNARRSNARRENKLVVSAELAVIFEVYKHRKKCGNG